ncbi:MAG: HIT domain-containing protein [Blastocatellia bacterium]|nr:HIT domain-containing protein [Blastocatellia bacterium]
MDHLWSPWRYQYIAKEKKYNECVFCRLPKEERDEETFIVYRGCFNYIVLNIFPYTSGHLLVIPFQHTSSFSDIEKEVSDEMMDLTKKCQAVLQQEYKPDGFNLGMNLGVASGAGVAEHLHMHILPRWFGDANFTSVIGETRILPEMLGNTFLRLKKYF